MTRWWYQLPLIYWMIGGKKMENSYTKNIDMMTSDLLCKRRKVLEEKKSINDLIDDGMGVIDRFILAGLTDEEIKIQTFVLFTTVRIDILTILKILVTFN